MKLITHPDVWLYITRLAIVLLTLFLVWSTYQSHLLLKRFQPDVNLLLSLPEILVRILLVAVCLFLAWLSGLSATQLGLVVTNPVRQMGIGLAAGFVIQLAANGVLWIIIRYYGRAVYSPLVIRNILPRWPVEWMLVPLAFIPAVLMEELLFRSLWLGVFGPVIFMPVLIVGTSIIFGIMHLPQGVVGAIGAGAVNILLALLFLWTGSLLAPFIAHYTINVSQLIMAHYQRVWLENY